MQVVPGLVQSREFSLQWWGCQTLPRRRCRRRCNPSASISCRALSTIQSACPTLLFCDASKRLQISSLHLHQSTSLPSSHHHPSHPPLTATSNQSLRTGLATIELRLSRVHLHLSLALVRQMECNAADDKNVHGWPLSITSRTRYIAELQQRRGWHELAKREGRERMGGTFTTGKNPFLLRSHPNRGAPRLALPLSCCLSLP